MSGQGDNGFGSQRAGERKKSVARQVMKMSVLCAGQIFGQEDVLHGRNHTTTVRCLSVDSQVFAIKAEEFNARMRRDDRTWRLLLSDSQSKDNSTLGKIRKNILTEKARYASPMTKLP